MGSDGAKPTQTVIWGNGDADLFKGAFYLVGEEKVWEEA